VVFKNNTELNEEASLEGRGTGQEADLWILLVGLSFYQKWTRVPDDYQQALKEMQVPDFVATWTWLTVWGI
jgi:hypothetical protein